MKRLWNCRETAEYLHMSEKTLRLAVADGLIPAARVGDRGWLRFDPEAVGQAIRAKLGRPAPQTMKGQ